ncbi:hypothetical protein TNCT_135961 [Trichonephila clavata]|uniref:Uncharacterized protein n=1 Tax=Trichonephila clavata TaxID=2740835 RepID=A0A8X6LSW1_TRICU|nr:hypothetical protein TNCT_135961 [Trichonephila clavata]
MVRGASCLRIVSPNKNSFDFSGCVQHVQDIHSGNQLVCCHLFTKYQFVLGCVVSLCAGTLDLLVTAAYLGHRCVSAGFSEIGAGTLLTSSCTISSSNQEWR